MGDLRNDVSALAVLRRAEGANDMPAGVAGRRARALRSAKRGFETRQFRRRTSLSTIWNGAVVRRSKVFHYEKVLAAS